MTTITPNPRKYVTLAKSLTRKGFEFSGCLSRDANVEVFIYSKRNAMGDLLATCRLNIRADGFHSVTASVSPSGHITLPCPVGCTCNGKKTL